MKTIRILMALLLCLCVCIPAMAELCVEPLYTYPSDSSVSLFGSINMLEIDLGDASYVAALDGTPVTEAVYCRFSESYGYLEAKSAFESAAVPGDEQELPLEGVIAADGRVAIPFIYNMVSVENEHWGIGYNLQKNEAGDGEVRCTVFNGDSFTADILSIDVYNLETGTLVGTLERDAFQGFDCNGPYMNVLTADDTIVAYDGDLQPLEDAAPSWLYDYSYAETETEYVSGDTRALPDSFYENGKYGIKDADGNVVYPAEYESAYVSSAYGMDIMSFCLTKDGVKTYGIIGFDGTVVMEPVYADLHINSCENGYAVLDVTDAEGNETYGVIDNNGSIVVPAEHEKIVLSYNDLLGYAKDGETYSLFSCLTGMIELEGLTESTCYVNVYNTTLHVNYKSDIDLADLLITADGTMTALEGWDSVSYCSHTDGMYWSVSSDSTHAIIDRTGNVVLPDCSCRGTNEEGTLMLVYNYAADCYELHELK